MVTTTDRWASAGRRLTPAHEAAARKLIEEHGGAAAFDLIVLSGSLVAGHGHDYSDIDIFVVPRKELRSGITIVDGFPVQFNPVTQRSLSEIANIFGKYHVTPSDRDQLFVMRPLLREAARLAYGKPLYVGPGLEDAYRACDRDVIRQLVITDCAREVGRHVEDAVGGKQAADPLVALHSSETALRLASEALLAASDDVYVGDSFFWRRLARTETTADLAPQIWRLLKDGPVWGTGLPQVLVRVDEILDLATYLVSVAQLDGWETPLHGAVSLPPGHHRVRRNPHFSVLRFGDTVSLIGPDQAYRSNHATARQWVSSLSALPETSTEQFLRMGLLVREEEIVAERR